MSKLIDLTGKTYGRLTVIEKADSHKKPSGNVETMWRCKCECGETVVVSGVNLKKGNTMSCGCLQKENRYGKRRQTEVRVDGSKVYAKAYGDVEFVASIGDLELVKSQSWHISKCGYVVNADGEELHQLIIKPQNGLVVHHLDENKLNNTKNNLITLTRADHLKMHKFLANGVVVLPCRCCECENSVGKSLVDGQMFCMLHKDGFNGDDFCSYAKRKGGDE